MRYTLSPMRDPHLRTMLHTIGMAVTSRGHALQDRRACFDEDGAVRDRTSDGLQRELALTLGTQDGGAGKARDRLLCCIFNPAVNPIVECGRLISPRSPRKVRGNARLSVRPSMNLPDAVQCNSSSEVELSSAKTCPPAVVPSSPLAHCPLPAAH